MRFAAFSFMFAALVFSVDFAQAADISASGKNLSEAEKEAIQKVIREYIVKDHPEVIVDAIKELRKREEEVARGEMAKSIISKKKELFEDPATPVGGNPKGNVTVVEFFDYQCGFCKTTEKSVENLLKNDKNVRFVYKEFPMLGPMSLQASRAAIASVKQGKDKYGPFHMALMNKQGHFNKEEDILAVAKDVGLNVEKLKKDMQDESVTKQVQASINLGSEIGVRGTPMLIVGDQAYPGALDENQLKEAVEHARNGGSKKSD